MKTTQFSNPRFDFGFVEKIAVLPLENLSTDSQAGERTTRILITELLSSGAVDVVEPGEVRAALGRIPGSHTTPTTEQVTRLGELLGVQAVITGAVTQSEMVRSGTISVPTVTLDLHMLETETGAPVWAATHTDRGSGVSTKILGTGVEPIAKTTRRCVRKTIRTLVK
jgi:TolB-like protein